MLAIVTSTSNTSTSNTASSSSSSNINSSSPSALALTSVPVNHVQALLPASLVSPFGRIERDGSADLHVLMINICVLCCMYRVVEWCVVYMFCFGTLINLFLTVVRTCSVTPCYTNVNKVIGRCTMVQNAWRCGDNSQCTPSRGGNSCATIYRTIYRAHLSCDNIWRVTISYDISRDIFRSTLITLIRYAKNPKT